MQDYAVSIYVDNNLFYMITGSISDTEDTSFQLRLSTTNSSQSSLVTANDEPAVNESAAVPQDSHSEQLPTPIIR